jgi:predicted nucleotidyltransferase
MMRYRIKEMDDGYDTGMRPDLELLEDLVDRVVQAAAPERIVLFGSAAHGRMGPHSDLDVLVVKSGNYRRIEVMHAIRRALRGFPHAVDLVVATPDELKSYGDSFSLVYYPALREGYELYAA